MSNTNDILIEIKGDDSGFKAASNNTIKGMKGIEGAANKTEKNIQGVNNSVASLTNVVKGFLGIGIVKYIGDLGKRAVKLASDLEQNQVAFEVLLGSASKAKDVLEEINKVSSKTPYQEADLIGVTRTMLNFGLSAEQSLTAMKQLTDISGGSADKMKSLALAYAQVQSTGKLMGQDLLQMINAGFNPLNVIAQKTGKSIGQLKEEMSKGAISAKDVADAFKAATSKGGQFYKMAEKQSKTLAGMISTLNDQTDLMLRNFGQKLIPAFKGLIEAFSLGSSSGGIFATVMGKITNFVALNVEYLTLFVTAIQRLYVGVQLLEKRIKGDKGKEFQKLQEQSKQLNTLMNNSYTRLKQNAVNLLGLQDLFGKQTDKNKKNLKEISKIKMPQIKTAKGLDKQTQKLTLEYEALRRTLKEFYDYDLSRAEFNAIKKQELQDSEKQKAEEFLSAKYDLNYEEFKQRSDLLKEYYNLEFTLQDQLAIKEAKKRQEAGKAYQDYLQARLGMDTTYWNGVASLTSQANTFMAQENKVLFRFGQALAVANVAINTAEAISKAFAQLGPIGGAIATPVLMASAGLQTATILSQQPPEKGTTVSRKLQTPKIKGFEGGGVIQGSQYGNVIGSYGNTLAVAGEKNMDEAIVPLENKRALKQIAESLASVGISSGNNVTVQQNNNIRGNVLSNEYVLDTLIPAMREQAEREGKELFYGKEFE